MLFCMTLPFVVDDHGAPGRAATDHPASVLFEKYSHGWEEDFSKSYLKGRIAGWEARKYLCAVNINHRGKADLPYPTKSLEFQMRLD